MKSKNNVLIFIYFPVTIIFYELFLRFFDSSSVFFTVELIPTVLFSVGLGLFISFFLNIIKPRILSRILAIVLTALLWVIFCVEYDCHVFYGMYYGITYAISMTGQVMGDFSSVVWEVALQYWYMELFFSIPLIILCIFNNKIIKKNHKFQKKSYIALMVGLTLIVSTSFISRNLPTQNIYTYDFTADKSVANIGLLKTFAIETIYMICGTPKVPLLSVSDNLWTDTSASSEVEASEGDVKPNDQEEGNVPEIQNPGSNSENNDIAENELQEEPEEIVYGYNACVDFAYLIENETDPTILKMHEYFGSLEPSMQNEYTGFFKGKNLIFLTAEAFSPYAIDENYTPTLYKLSHEGFVFTNYYQPSWALSTTGGEFANMTGVIPEWINSGNSFTESASKYMPYAPGNLFKKEGYVCRAYHNNSYNYYDRDKTHPNLGYDYKGIGNGLSLSMNYWPASDLDMIQNTIDEAIDGYLETGVPFHNYYMTVSGHCSYSWGGNAMSKKNKESAQEAFPDACMEIQAYMACNKELDLALSYLLQKLDEAGISDDTVIVMGADHYPYAMAKGNTDTYVTLSGIEDTEKDISRYKNTLILYCSEMEEPIVIDTPCSSIDIVPTLANLFGIEYDSRLYSGRDIFATNYDPSVASTCMPLVIVPNGGSYSFVTAAGEYNAFTKEFTPYDGITVDENYVSDVKKLMQAKWNYAKLLITNDYYKRTLGMPD